MNEKRLRVLSYNIHKGFSIGNRQFVLDKIKEGIHKVGADLVFLQEVLGEHAEHAETVANWPEQSQFEYLSDEIWPHYAYGRNSVYLSGHHGNAILSKYPITWWENMDISTNPFEQRGVLHCAIQIPESSEPIDCLCLHLNLFESGRRAQLQMLCARVLETIPSSHPCIIAGDFNDWAGNATDRLFESISVNEVFESRLGKHAATYPAWFPFFELDRIYQRGFKICNAQVLKGDPWRKLSDHAPMLAELSYSVPGDDGSSAG